jgi:hypothetical protein
MNPINLGELQGETLSAKHLSFLDLIYIKKLKNTNKEMFFYDKNLSNFRHLNWYLRYLVNKDNIFWVLMIGKINYGTVGIKKTNIGYELYSVIRDSSKRYYSNAMYLLVGTLISHYSRSENIYCKVKKGNSAIEWYYKLGFKLQSENLLFYNLVLERDYEG